jgi:hypothetical protein
MKKLTTLFLGLSVAVGFTNANIDPQADQDAFINYFKKANPNVALEDYSVGAYALDEVNRGQFEDILSGSIERCSIDGSVSNDEIPSLLT